VSSEGIASRSSSRVRVSSAMKDEGDEPPLSLDLRLDFEFEGDSTSNSCASSDSVWSYFDVCVDLEED